MPKKPTTQSLKKATKIKPKKSVITLTTISESVTEWMGSISSLVVHTILFFSCFVIVYLGFMSMENMLAILTNIVSLEAIYLAIFIQMAVNKNTKSLREVEKDIDEIQEDVEEIQEDVEEIQEDVEEIQEDVEEIEKDVDSIEKDVDELQEDVEEIQESTEEDVHAETEEEKREKSRDDRIDRVVSGLDLIQKQLDVLFDEMKKAKNKK